jgi:hypothetical protein
VKRRSVLQIVVAFLSTVIVCGLLIFGARTIVMQYFDEDTEASTSGNVSMTLTNPVTDSEQAYRDSVVLSPGETDDEIIEGNIAESSPDLPDDG